MSSLGLINMKHYRHLIYYHVRLARSNGFVALAICSSFVQNQCYVGGGISRLVQHHVLQRAFKCNVGISLPQ